MIDMSVYLVEEVWQELGVRVGIDTQGYQVSFGPKGINMDLWLEPPLYAVKSPIDTI